MNYLLEALRSLTVHHPRTMQRLNPKRGPYEHCWVRREASRYIRHSELVPEYVHIRLRGMAPQFPPMHHPFGAAPVPHLVSFPAIREPKDMLPSPLGPHILSSTASLCCHLLCTMALLTRTTICYILTKR